ncbi:putative DNA binding domain-containing protein [Candidatus Haliotispira prima]|uniref:DNA binding domain-containing protein n=1 Tax=Candidatus Haliotispira prima TaxID=3034016 RepID=A0ABY8MEN9_9SPIO|nr:putative DNA binding domain-containing protein [Candidatus Haliotispira prima]
MINKQELSERLSTGEDSSTEFKTSLGNLESIAGEITAFLNFQGGWLIFGVDDEGAAVGLKPDEKKSILQQLDNVMQDHIRPAVSLTISNVLLNEKLLIVVEVEQGQGIYSTKQGRYYIRAGTAKREMRREEIERKALTLRPAYPDELPIEPYDDEKLNRPELKAYIGTRGFELSSATPEQRFDALRRMNLAGNDGQINVAGALLFYKEMYRAGFEIKAVAYPGTDSGDTFTDKATISGNLARQYKQAESFLFRNLPQRPVDGFNTSKLAIAKEALQEVLVNALIHRDYGITSPVRILVFSDRLEIVSPGGLPNHLDTDKIKNGTNISRNPTLSGHAHHILPYSGIGTGIQRILKHHPDTRFEDKRDDFIFLVTMKL